MVQSRGARQGLRGLLSRLRHRKEADVLAPLRQQPLLVRVYHYWFSGKRRLLDSAALAKATRVTRHASYIGVVAQAAVMAGLQKTIPALLAVNLALVFMFAVASILSQWLPRREVRPKVLDVHYVRELQIKYSNLLHLLGKHSTSSDCLEVLGDVFTRQAFEAACRAVCADRDVRVSYMVEDDDRTLRVQIIFPEAGTYKSQTEIQLAVDNRGYKVPPEGLGVGGFAQGLCRSVYVPNVSVRSAYLVDAALDGNVTYEWLGRSWKDSGAQRYKCVISVPVFVREEDLKRPLGVLNFESRYRDSFGSADFHVACLMAGLLALGLKATMEMTTAFQS